MSSTGPLVAAEIVPRSWRRIGPALVWDGEPGAGAVFDPLSGETHFLAELPALFAATVDADWASAPELVARYAGQVDLDDVAKAQILTALTSLEAAEIVESRTS